MKPLEFQGLLFFSLVDLSLQMICSENMFVDREQNLKYNKSKKICKGRYLDDYC